ncbi:MAG: RluA family pseudouridine synthase [Pegethrix bostrychoides GSE-TBD4-15B]|jgi:RluA family pseudouridine synthase|uniref:RNA pseudouridylate synthase n=1 Tax=Pegethrix bostrychoides GSE-TBD4-15B TaxID=2839662 RepID=A0A951PB93_9CYAN|nr:RluA family pseudouridine synthase [Pegethrix bostrychoides GSE-TBD4-15B]
MNLDSALSESDVLHIPNSQSSLDWSLAEAEALAQLAEIKRLMIALQQMPERLQYAQRRQEFEQRLSDLAQQQQQRRQQRQQIRQQQPTPELLAQLERQSQQDGLAKRYLKRARDEALQPFQQVIAAADAELQSLKQRHRAISQNLRQLQAAYTANYQANFPELLLSGSALEILYEDAELIAINKPAGLLSVPGRGLANQDCAVSRLRRQYGELLAVHRLDQATSGVLLLAKTLPTYRQVSQQFAQRQVQKTYEVLLAGRLDRASGCIDLPLWGDPDQRPRQVVDWQRGKPSQTQFRVLSGGETTRVEFLPLSGRTHQIRVHAADLLGLATPILGDALYGELHGKAADRLYLHAKALRFYHPQLGQLQLHCETPF